MKSVLWRVAKRLSYREDARCLKVNFHNNLCEIYTVTFWLVTPNRHFITCALGAFVTTYLTTVVLDKHRRDSLLCVLEFVSYNRMGICEDICKVKIKVEIVKFASVFGQSVFSYWNSC